MCSQPTIFLSLLLGCFQLFPREHAFRSQVLFSSPYNAEDSALLPIPRVPQFTWDTRNKYPDVRDATGGSRSSAKLWLSPKASCTRHRALRQPTPPSTSFCKKWPNVLPAGLRRGHTVSYWLCRDLSKAVSLFYAKLLDKTVTSSVSTQPRARLWLSLAN